VYCSETTLFLRTNRTKTTPGDLTHDGHRRTAQDTTTPDAAPRHVYIGIVGAGFAGLGMAIRLKQAGIEDFVVWERDGDVGGTWWANTYPGCQCDVPSHLYSFSLRSIPTGAARTPCRARSRTTCATSRRSSASGGTSGRTAEVADATWDDTTDRWRVTTADGAYTADILVAAPGPLSEPSIPDLPGLDTFAGTTFHTANWNHDHDLTGRRIAVIGTGASAIQAPEIQPIVNSLTVFQRTRPWVVPHRDRPITDAERHVYRALPPLQRAVRAGVYFGRELLVPGLVYRPKLMSLVQSVATKHLHKHVTDPELRRKLTPDYAIGCKRVLPSNRWYPALTRANIELVTDGIDHVRPDGIVGANGDLHEVDTIVFATGFHVTDIRIARRVTGRAGTRSPRSGTAAPRPTAARQSPGSRTCSSSSVRTPASATIRSSS
jgi:cation diffusion facilitator CzcD-associated flavoprotein CzcO